MNNVIIVRGAGDLATAVIHKLHNCGFKIIALEVETPLAIRRKVSFSEAIYEKEVSVEGVYCVYCKDKTEIKKALNKRKVALIIDPKGKYIDEIRPVAVIDCILAKKNIGTNKAMAPLTIALGPGFCAGKDADIVIETMRGHNLGKVIREGYALKNTGIPGAILGITKDRVFYSENVGIIETICNIGDVVKKGDIICYITEKNGNKIEVKTSLDGVLRGILRNGSQIEKGLKILDIDPRMEEVKNSFTISDKGRCIAGAVLEALLSEGILPE
ncbi:selenium-dependent molybdenum cofactor biosynthesis protein YqeB [Clostridioides sp. ZZV14-6153]|uniref:selenium-dependent molybdenum cofactor biosynthesis protein YqeB n=1 Tax=Clostridioides sp. ZZV14-6153 TaxID=2811494 RepID=UPI001D108F4B|nr:EF2563 family selenium-dependent molybdenum hydroxylase system protein [Clostridioides sp. ZZV14-6153]